MDLFSRPQSNAYVRYISHRGFQPLAPANSLPSFAYAGALHQWAIETDVHETRDGVLVCCHDARVDALFDGEGAIREMTWAELSRLRMNKGNRLNCLKDEQKRMPLFSEYLSICRHFGSIPFIETKVDQVDKIIHAVHEAGLSDEEVVMSTASLDRLIETRKISKNMFVHWIFGTEDRLEELARLGNAGMSWNYTDPLASPVEKIHLSKEAGVKVCLRAADSVEAVDHMLSLGLDYLPSNCMHNPLQGGI